MVRNLYRHPRAVETATKLIVNKLLSKTEESWIDLTFKRKNKLLKTVKLALKKAEKVALTRPPL